MFTWVLLLLASIWLRFRNLDAISFWYDECFSVGMARLDWSGMAHAALHREINMVFYYAVLKIWLLVAHNEIWVRGLSALFGVSSIAAAGVFAHETFGAKVGVMTASFLTFHNYLIQYSQEARGYSLATLLAILAAQYLWRAVERNSSLHWAMFSVITVLGIYTHMYISLLVAAQWVWLIASRRWNRKAGWAYMSIVVAILPILYVIAENGLNPIAWIHPLNVDQMVKEFRELSGIGSLFLPIAIAALCLYASIAVRKSSNNDDARAFGAIISMAALPFVFAMTAAMFKPLFFARYMMFCLPFLAIAAAVAIARLPKLLAWSTFLIVLLPSLFTVVLSIPHAIAWHDDIRSATRYTIAQARLGDEAVFYFPTERVGFETYRWFDGHSSALPKVVLPSNAEPWLDLIVKPLGEELQGFSLHGDRVWLIYDEPGGDFDHTFGILALRALVGKKYTLQSKQQFDGGVRVWLYVKK